MTHVTRRRKTYTAAAHANAHKNPLAPPPPSLVQLWPLSYASERGDTRIPRHSYSTMAIVRKPKVNRAALARDPPSSPPSDDEIRKITREREEKWQSSRSGECLAANIEPEDRQHNHIRCELSGSGGSCQGRQILEEYNIREMTREGLTSTLYVYQSPVTWSRLTILGDTPHLLSRN